MYDFRHLSYVYHIIITFELIWYQRIFIQLYTAQKENTQKNEILYIYVPPSVGLTHFLINKDLICWIFIMKNR